MTRPAEAASPVLLTLRVWVTTTQLDPFQLVPLAQLALAVSESKVEPLSRKLKAVLPIEIVRLIPPLLAAAENWVPPWRTLIGPMVSEDDQLTETVHELFPAEIVQLVALMEALGVGELETVTVCVSHEPEPSPSTARAWKV